MFGFCSSLERKSSPDLKHYFQVKQKTPSDLALFCLGIQGLHLFQEMSLKQVRFNEFSYNAIISMLERGNQWQRAFHMFARMPDQELVPNTVSFNTTISSLERAQQWQGALHLFNHMQECNIDPDVISYNSSSQQCLTWFFNTVISVFFNISHVGCISWKRNCKSKPGGHTC